jgi:TrmH family RNA methyltransferase
MSEKITSSTNKTIKFVKQIINDKKYRDTSEVFSVETYRIAKQLIDNKYILKYVLVSSSSKYVRTFAKDQTFIVNDAIFSSLSSLGNSDGVIGIFVKQKKIFHISPNKKYLILDRIQNPNNFGAITRICVAFGLDGIIVSNDSVDIYNPTVIRGSMGAIFCIPIMVTTDLSKVISELKQKQYKIYSTALDKTAHDLATTKFPSSCAIIFGNEGNGIEQKYLKMSDEIIRIKISEQIDSLNIAATVAIVA